jgi:hypothetical protein
MRRHRMDWSWRLQQGTQPQRRGDFGEIAGQPLHDLGRRREMARKPARHDAARRCVDGFEEPQRQLRVMALLVDRVRELLHVEVGKDAQQGWTHIGRVAQAEIGEAVEAHEALSFHCTVARSQPLTGP